MKNIYLKEINSDTLDWLQSYIDNEESFRITLNSPGGDLNAAFAIYDYLRTLNKDFFITINGMAHSAAVVILLAADLEKRTANPLATSLIHQVYTELDGDYNSDQLQMMADEVRIVKEKMAKIYSERTNLTFEESLLIIEEEKERDTEWLLDNGFIGSINLYKNNMNLILKIKNLLKKENKEIKDAEGNLLFTVDENIELGAAAEPDGTYDVEGKIVIVEDGEVKEIKEPETEAPVETPVEPIEEPIEVQEDKAEEVPNYEEIITSKDLEIEDLKVELDEKNTELLKKDEEIAELKTALEESLSAMKELKATITSNYVPEKRYINNIKEVSLYDKVKSNLGYFN